MSDESAVSLSRGISETVLPPVPPEWETELEAARRRPDREERRAAVSSVAAAHPRYLAAWAELSGLARDEAEAYAYARVGYHRGLDALRQAGWRGTGFVRAGHAENRGFLAALEALRRCAGAVGEAEEEERCALFLAQLDPDWGR